MKYMILPDYLKLIIRIQGVLLGMLLLFWAVSANFASADAGAGKVSQLDTALPSVPSACGPAWMQISGPGNVTKVAVPGPDNAWAAGGNTITHWNGSAWSVASYPTPTVPSGYTSAVDEFHGIDSRDTGEVWVTGITIQEPAFMGQNPYALLYYNGSTWQRVTGALAAGDKGDGASADPDGGYYDHQYLYGVAAVGPGEAWVVGRREQDSGNAPIVKHVCLNGGACPSATPSVANPQTTVFVDAASTAPDDVYVVGYDGSGGLIYHWDGSAWTSMVHDPIGNILAVDAQVPNEAWAAGSGGILHYDVTWDQVLAPNYAYTDLVIQSQNSIWASSVSGMAYGDTFSLGTMPSPSGASGLAIDQANYDDLWAVGPNYLHYPDVPLFTDVTIGNNFYPYIQSLACRNLIAGYSTNPPCVTGTPCFLPGNSLTRGQIAKFISNAAGYTDTIPPSQQTFTDVPSGNTFWVYIERAYAHGVIGGYTSSPPCTTGVPCFLPGNNVTRGQTAKFVSNAAGYADTIPPSQQTFTDVPSGNTFWQFIERAHNHNVIGGYTSNPPCTTGTPCFLPGNNVTRGQVSKFISNAFITMLQPPVK